MNAYSSLKHSVVILFIIAQLDGGNDHMVKFSGKGFQISGSPQFQSPIDHRFQAASLCHIKAPRTGKHE